MRDNGLLGGKNKVHGDTRMTLRINFRAKNGEEVWNRRKFVPRASFKTKTTTKALIGFHNPYFWILRHLSSANKLRPWWRKGFREETLYYPSVLCQEYQILPQNHTPAVAKHFWRTSSHSFLFPLMNLLWKEIWWKERYGLAFTFSTDMQLMS